MLLVGFSACVLAQSVDPAEILAEIHGNTVAPVEFAQVDPVGASVAGDRDRPGSRVYQRLSLGVSQTGELISARSRCCHIIDTQLKVCDACNGSHVIS